MGVQDLVFDGYWGYGLEGIKVSFMKFYELV